MELSRKAEVCEYTASNASGSENGSGFRSTPFTTENSAVLAPMPSASVKIAMAAKLELFDSTRRPKRTSCQKFRTRFLPSALRRERWQRYARARSFVPTSYAFDDL